jgi:mono/diheme cytochrome c family protein
VVALAVAAAHGATAQQPDLGTEAERAAGKKLYDKFCAQCHGANGDGQGVAAPYLEPKPRDFTAGKYKIRTTQSGALPTDEDLRSILRRGMPYTSMPAWPEFTEEELQNIVYHLKTFSRDFANPELAPRAIEVPRAPARTEDTVRKGREAYEKLGCIRCHGELGRGDGMSAPTLTDDWGNPLRAADLTAKWTFRGGATREDLFRTLSTGLNGTPMPSYADALGDEERWHLVDYIVSLSPTGETAPYTTLAIVKPVDEPLDLDRGAELFEVAPEAMFPIVGQIMQPGRSTHPRITNVRLRAVHSRDEIAFLVRWNDMRADTAGRNDPSLAVTEADTLAAVSVPAAEEAQEQDFWGEEAVEQQAEQPAPGDFWGEEEAEAAAGPAVSASPWSDAVAIQLPMELLEGIRKPYFIMGDAEQPVDLWFVDLARGEAKRFTARGSANVVPGEGSEVTALAGYDRGEWSVMFKRSLKSAEGMTFAEGQFVPIAFSVWDGFSQERGNRRGLTQWFYLYLEPRQKVSATRPMIRAALSVLAVELALVGWIRWRHRGERGPQRVERPAIA